MKHYYLFTNIWLFWVLVTDLFLCGFYLLVHSWTPVLPAHLVNLSYLKYHWSTWICWMSIGKVSMPHRTLVGQNLYLQFGRCCHCARMYCSIYIMFCLVDHSSVRINSMIPRVSDMEGSSFVCAECTVSSYQVPLLKEDLMHPRPHLSSSWGSHQMANSFI